MNPDPISDTLMFLVQPGWTTGIFWLLLLGSIAERVVQRAPCPVLSVKQRNPL